MENGSTTTPKAKMSGYLHLKTKKRMLSSWKSYWFVLEDRLLLYYRSKDEYQAISPCKGSINLGPPCTLKCLTSLTNAFQIETRTTTYTLKATNSDEQKQWMQILLSALPQNQNVLPKQQTTVTYSLDNLIPEVEPHDYQLLRKRPFQRQNTMPHRLQNRDDEMIRRLQKLGAHSYGGSLEAITKIATKKNTSPTLSTSKGSLPDYYYQADDFLRPRQTYRENIYERISGDSQTSGNRDSFSSFVVDNDNYSVPIRKSLGTRSFLVENDQYTTRRQICSDEVIYAEPKIEKITDCNKNSVLVENTLYATPRRNSENLYEDLEEYNKKESKNKNKKNGDEKSLKKSKSFIKRVWKKRHKKEKHVEEEIYSEIDPGAASKVEISDDNAVQMLSELHNILETKKTKLRAATSTSSQTDFEASPGAPGLEPQRPELPPKIHKISPQTPISLDEILQDLDREKLESKSKVKQLIEKFSETDVTLRTKLEPLPCRHSDELDRLLDQLVQVTSAPIMTPGVTSSLVNTNLDDELLKLLPKRERRLSEPDYDIPRPHKSIQQLQQQEVDAIPVTRFFGPVLSTDKDEEEDVGVISMTPDSLEVEERPIIHYSYTSDQCLRVQDDDVVYALPKSYVATHVVNTCPNIYSNHDECTIIYKNVTVGEESFVDSLELCNG